MLRSGHPPRAATEVKNNGKTMKSILCMVRQSVTPNKPIAGRVGMKYLYSPPPRPSLAPIEKGFS